ncbi:MAG TPA: helix-turn-helix domain-containing protein [Nitrospiraceae bacterium]|nr:helix-turn-helix domain-containing protein [Nitrospiraceae bacterium]
MALDLLERKTLMTLQEVSDLLRVSQSTVKKKSARGEIPSVKIGRARRFRPEDVYRYISANTRQSGGTHDAA